MFYYKRYSAHNLLKSFKIYSEILYQDNVFTYKQNSKFEQNIITFVDIIYNSIYVSIYYGL